MTIAEFWIEYRAIGIDMSEKCITFHFFRCNFHQLQFQTTVNFERDSFAEQNVNSALCNFYRCHVSQMVFVRVPIGTNYPLIDMRKCLLSSDYFHERNILCFTPSKM